jgi:Tfp pilus assembly protein PilX
MRAPLRSWNDEQGAVLVLALFMVLVMSTLGVSLSFVSQTETWSSQNYKMMSQARYAAEAGVHAAANHLMFTYVPPGTNPADSLANYTTTTTPVQHVGNGNAVVLATEQADSNYPVSGVQTAFANALAAATVNGMTTDNGVANFSVKAKLLNSQVITNWYTSTPVTLQTWELTGIGKIPGARVGETEVTAILERPKQPVYGYAAFATHDGCAALNIAGGFTTDSYDSQDPLVGGVPVTAPHSGAVGTNGNLTGVGDPTQVNGSLSTPRSGVGACTANNITAQTLTGNASVEEGLIELAQPIEYPTPDLPNPMPPSSGSLTFNGGSPCGTIVGCTEVAGEAWLDPSVTGGTMLLSNISMNGGTRIHMKPGNYHINSLQQNGGAEIVIEPGPAGYAPVIINLAGVGSTNPLKLNGNGVTDPSYDPMILQFVYAGSDHIILNGGAQAAGLLYAPNASSEFAGGYDWYGAVVTKYVTGMGGATIHYDRRLMNDAFVAGNFVMSAFTWKKS